MSTFGRVLFDRLRCTTAFTRCIVTYMKFTLTIETDNAALIDETDEVDFDELARILSGISEAASASRAAGGGPVFDLNGNTIGAWELS